MVRKVCIVGSGNWGSVIAKIIGLNIQGKPDEFNEKLPMYVYEELVDGAKLTEIINSTHVNVKYMPSCILPNNVIADPDVISTVKDADIIVFVLPHQFMERICSTLAGKIKPTALGVSLIKGLDISQGLLDLVSNVVRRHLKIECAVLMGANIAPEVARENYCEATIGCKDLEMGKVLKQIFQTPYFRITVVPDEKTVELCGALKNIVALGAGFVDGMDYGDNTKAAVIRLGLMEMVAFAKEFFQNEDIGTFFESCGVADLVTTCYSGRNKRIAEAYARNPQKSIENLEAELLNGQKLQGPPTAAEVNAILKKEGIEERYPMFTSIHNICVGLLDPRKFIDCLRDHPAHM